MEDKFLAGGVTPPASRWSRSTNTLTILITIAFDALVIWLIAKSIIDGLWIFAATISLIALIINYAFLNRKNYPLRWLIPSISMLILMVIYPLAYTLYSAFTNYSQSQLLSKQQALQVIESRSYLPEGAPKYRWMAYRSPDRGYLLLLISEHEQAKLLAPAGQALNTNISISNTDIPEIIDSYIRLTRIETVKYLTELTDIDFGLPPSTYRIKSLNEAAQYQQRYIYEPDIGSLLDQETGTLFTPVEGTFTAEDGQILVPSFYVPIGFRNFTRWMRFWPLTWAFSSRTSYLR